MSKMTQKLGPLYHLTCTSNSKKILNGGSKIVIMLIYDKVQLQMTMNEKIFFFLHQRQIKYEHKWKLHSFQCLVWIYHYTWILISKRSYPMMFSQMFSVKPSFWKYFLWVKLAESTPFSTSGLNSRASIR